MKKVCTLTCAVFCLLTLFGGDIFAEQAVFEYPYYLVDAYDPDDSCWKGMGVDGTWPVPVDPLRWLVGPPPSAVSGVTLPTEHWVELRFCGSLVDGPGQDMFLIEQGQCGEQALIFLTDGAGQEYLLDIVTALDTQEPNSTKIGLDIAGIPLHFSPNAVRILALDLEGGSPGFDIGSLRVRVHAQCQYIASCPLPCDGAKNVPPNVVLSWASGCSAEKHIVYFGSSLDNVGANALPVSNPPQPQDTNSFDPGWLEFGKTYYWRIDEVNPAPIEVTPEVSPLVEDTSRVGGQLVRGRPDSLWKGTVWRFTVADHLVLDNFEFYRNDDEIYQTWKEKGRARVGIATNPAYKCWQSMQFWYYYEPEFFAEVSRTFDPPQDWAAMGAKVLELFFYGAADNSFDGQMYVTIGDGSVTASIPYPGDPNDLTKQTWQLFRIGLQELAELNLAHIETIAIGFRSDPAKPLSVGSGIVYFDYLSLYPSLCLAENRPDADFNCDCAVNFEDLKEMTADWLDTGYHIYPVAMPKPPLAWYKFDGDTNDSAGSSHGVPHGSPTYAAGVFGQAISFDGLNDSVTINGAFELFSKINKKITIAFWQYGKDSPHHTDTICCSNYTYGIRNPTIAINLGCWQQPGKYNWDCGYPWSFDNRLSGFHGHKREWTGRWNHWAFTKDATTGTMQIFLNGVLYDSRTGADSPISQISSFEIGSGWYGRYDGLLDDFRIYDYVLSQPEIAYVATNGTGIFDLPLLSPADLFADNRINFYDFALLATDWLDNHLWP